jgi:para-aminobenzoate synthetase
MTVISSTVAMGQAVAFIAACAERHKRTAIRSCVIGIDGGSGAGKSTLAHLLAAKLKGAVIASDDFYAAHIPDMQWQLWTPAERYASVLDWKRLRREALQPLLSGDIARWHPFDFDARRADGTYPLSTTVVERQPTDYVVLEGTYSTRPELADLIDVTILVDVPARIRHQRLALREDPAFLEAWHARWDPVEAHYFSQVRPAPGFAIVVSA